MKPLIVTLLLTVGAITSGRTLPKTQQSVIKVPAGQTGTGSNKTRGQCSPGYTFTETGCIHVGDAALDWFESHYYCSEVMEGVMVREHMRERSEVLSPNLCYKSVQ